MSDTLRAVVNLDTLDFVDDNTGSDVSVWHMVTDMVEMVEVLIMSPEKECTRYIGKITNRKDVRGDRR